MNNNNWEDRFDEKFKLSFEGWLNEDEASPGMIKAFIRSEIKRARLDGVEMLIQMLPYMPWKEDMRIAVRAYLLRGINTINSENDD